MTHVEIIQLAWGPAFAGFIVSVFLYGITVAQTNLYVRSFPEDTCLLKILVLSLLVLDTVQAVLLTVGFWVVLIKRNIDENWIEIMPWQIAISPFYTAFTAFIVQSFFTLRVWRLSGNRILGGVIICFTLSQIAAGIEFAIFQISVRQQANSHFNFVGSSIQLGSGAIGDVIITGSLVYYLWSKRTGVPRSESILQRLITYTVNVSIFGCISTITALVLLHIEGENHYSTPFSFIISKCYVNSLLATLNSRKTFRELFEYHGERFTLPALSNVNSARLLDVA